LAFGENLFVCCASFRPMHGVILSFAYCCAQFTLRSASFKVRSCIYFLITFPMLLNCLMAVLANISVVPWGIRFVNGCYSEQSIRHHVNYEWKSSSKHSELGLK